MDRPDEVSVIFIAASPERVWAALVDPELNGCYFYRAEFGEMGGSFRLLDDAGEPIVTGEVLARDEPRRLAVTWIERDEAFRESRPSRVEYLLEPMGEVTRLTVNGYNAEPVPEEHRDAGREGWAEALSGLKTLVETGTPMPQPKRA